MRERAMGWESTVEEKSDGVRVYHEKKSDESESSPREKE